MKGRRKNMESQGVWQAGGARPIAGPCLTRHHTVALSGKGGSTPGTAWETEHLSIVISQTWSGHRGNVVLTWALTPSTHWLIGTYGLLLIGDRQHDNYPLGVCSIPSAFQKAPGSSAGSYLGTAWFFPLASLHCWDKPLSHPQGSSLVST